MTSIQRLLVQLMLALGLAGSALAQEPSPSHLQAARELVTASGAVNSIDRIIPALGQGLRQQGVTRPEIQKDLDEIVKALEKELEGQRQQAITVAARSYTKFLSEAEIKDAVAFFRSPAGAKYVRVQPELQEDVINAVTAWSQLAAEYMQVRTRSEMLKRGHDMQ